MPLAMLPDVGNFHKRRYDMEMLSELPAICEGNPRVTGTFPSEGASNVELRHLLFVSQNNESSRWWFYAYLRPILPTWIDFDPIMDK